MQSAHDQQVLVGRIVGLLGIQGWIKIESYTHPRDNIRRYSPWLVQSGASCTEYTVESVRTRGKGMSAKLAGIDNRDAAAELVGSQIRVDSTRLPGLEPGQFYWRDLIGLKVINRRDEPLGTVTSLMETGANDVLVVRGQEQELLIPYIPEQVILSIDQVQGVIRVDWEISY